MDSHRTAADLRTLRSRAGYGLLEFARVIGEPSSTYATYEAGRFKKEFIPLEKVRAWGPYLLGRGNPPITAGELAALAGTTVDYLKLAPPAESRQPARQVVDDPAEVALLRFWRLLRDDERRVILRWIEARIEEAERQ
jgi:transcriptional regulator with XRE-family HTH domain